MIELIHAERCIDCNLCVKTCPRDVFDATDGTPVIARQEDCQTCFLCELYCPVDALYVAPQAEARVPIDAAAIETGGQLGGYVRAMGWRRGKPGGTENDPTRHLRVRGAG
ncbi:4Fe-4S dicluster-binding protein [Uliginosibacterium sp. sgz301328]|uniref:4Fe-4S dicluster-binding protein n=1 Tax=Uliginosibacterium sp. sgz301328 TaxID=3243764 RepID=UPI00359CC73C